MAKTNIEDSRKPWGYYDVLSDGKDYKVKRITVHPGRRLSYQCHKMRDEHWFVVIGAGMVTMDGKETELKAGQSVNIMKGIAHRIKNIGQDDLVFIEVQTGDYFGEDDIERLEDDFGRV